MKDEKLTEMDLQQQVDMLQDQLRNLNEEVQSLNEQLKKANKDTEDSNRWWMKAVAERDEARQMLKSLKTIVAAIDVENLFK